MSDEDVRATWLCDCGATETTPGDLPKGWEAVQTGPDGCEFAYRCPRCAALAAEQRPEGEEPEQSCTVEGCTVPPGTLH